MATNSHPRVFFVANGLFGNHMSGGDRHFLRMAEAAQAANATVVFIGGRITGEFLKRYGLNAMLHRTDSRIAPKTHYHGAIGQCRLLLTYLRRAIGSLRHLRTVGPDDTIYAVSDGWWDVLPVALSRARHKFMMLHMPAPSLREVLLSSRDDIAKGRLAALHYWFSQRLSLWMLRQCRHKTVFYGFPALRAYLTQRGFKPHETAFLTCGIETELASQAPMDSKRYDLAWIGRVHRQKGLEDLLNVLRQLATELPGFRAVLLGQLDELRSDIEATGLSACVDMPGVLTGVDKFQTLKASRLFLMPSHYEGWPAVIGEALACRMPVVAYALPNYEGLGEGLVQYVPMFDVAALYQKARDTILASRQERIVLDEETHARLCNMLSLAAAQEVFVKSLLGERQSTDSTQEGSGRIKASQ